MLAAPAPPAPEAGTAGEGGGEVAAKRKSGRRPARRAGRCRRPRSRSSRRAANEEGPGEVEDQEFQPHHALNVPREADLSALSAPGEDEPATTVMLKHIPCRYTQGTLLRELDQLGFEGRYDFFYLPMDVRNLTSVGYAFINFVHPATATEFTAMMENYRFQRHPSDKIAEASPAHLQGLRRNVAHFSSRRVLRARDAKFRPIVLQEGFKRDFAELLAEFEREDRAQSAGAARDVAQPAGSPSAGLNPMAHDFVPGATAFGQEMPEEASGQKLTKDLLPAKLNPLAQEFVPSAPPGLPAPALPAHTWLGASATAPTPTVNRPLSPQLGEARRGLEEVVAGLLRTRQAEKIVEEVVSSPEPSAAMALSAGADEELPASEHLTEPEAEPATGQQPVQQPMRRPRHVPPALESVCDLKPQAAAPRKGKEDPESGEGSWVEAAFGALVHDPVLGGDDSASWIAEAFVALIDDEPSMLGQGGGSWVAEAFGKLVGCVPAPRPRRLIGALVSPSPTEQGGGWIAEAFSTLGRGCRTPAASRRKSGLGGPAAGADEGEAVEQQLGWVAEALRALASGKRQGDAPLKDCSAPACGPAPAPGTPRRIGGSLQRLRALGGWAWVAFA